MVVMGGFATAPGALNLLIYGSTIAAFEREKGITRGEPKSILSAKAFGEYFPDPGAVRLWDTLPDWVGYSLTHGVV